ncbi:MAG TPA: hypothetical protein VJ821_03140 [Anaerolineales bacterium]|nr:hypothetical protein [Anaerolineales bacterium]
MLFSRDFLELNLKFARKVSEAAGQSFLEFLLEYTHLYLAFGLGSEFDSRHPLWQSYINQVENQSDQTGYTYSFYLEQKAKQPEQLPAKVFGCFSYALWEDNRVRLHFHSWTEESGVLQKQNAPKRIAELKALFKSLKEIVPDMSIVVGGSWLYNIEAYRRLFPTGYLKTAQVGEDECQFMALWGQFLFHNGNVRQHLAQSFLEGIEKQNTLQNLKDCFPYQVLRLESSIIDFYRHYDIA